MTPEAKAMETVDALLASGLQRARNRVPYEATRRLIHALSIFIENLPEIRNIYAHGSAMLHSSVLGTFEIVTDLINQLFRSKGTECGTDCSMHIA